MKENKKPTILDCVEQVFKPFENKYGEVEISENSNPSFVMFINVGDLRKILIYAL